MKSLIKIFFFTLFTAVLVTNCGDDPSMVGSHLLPSEDSVEFKLWNSYDDSIAQTSSYFMDEIELGQSTRLLLGKYENVESSVLMRFWFGIHDTLSEKIESGEYNVTKAWVEIRPYYNVGDSLAQFDFTVHRANNYWTAEFDRDSLALLDIDYTDLSSNHNITDSLITFDLDVGIVNFWLEENWDTTLANNGIYLKPTLGTERVAGFQAYSTYVDWDLPLVYYELDKGAGGYDTLSTFSISDVHIVDGTLPTGEFGNSFLQAGLPVRSTLSFNLEALPQHAVINRATLTLYLDSLATINGYPRSDTLRVFAISDSTNLILEDSTSYHYLLYSEQKYSGNITNFVQHWVEEWDNQGMRLNLSDEERGLAKIVFRDSKYPDRTVRPNLEIVYTIKY